MRNGLKIKGGRRSEENSLAFGRGRGEFPPNPQVRGFHGPDGRLLCWLPFLCRAWLRGHPRRLHAPYHRRHLPFLQAHISRVWSWALPTPGQPGSWTNPCPWGPAESSALGGAPELLVLIPLVDWILLGLSPQEE